VGVTLRGWVADSGYTFWVGEGEPPADVVRLLTACRASLFAAVEQCVDGHHLSDVGHAVQARVEEDGFGVIRSLVGHGVGRRMHEDPQIPNYGPPGRGHVLRPGMTLAVEPMITASGETDVQLDEEDGWSIYSADHSLTAHYEHTIAVTDDGPLILTRHEGWSPVDDEVTPTP
jgi:methionyl aminopeptidase